MAELTEAAARDLGLRIISPDRPGIRDSKFDPNRILLNELVITGAFVYDDDERIFDAMCAGASGYLLKNTPPSRLLESLREVVSGGGPMSPEVARRVVELFRTIPIATWLANTFLVSAGVTAVAVAIDMAMKLLTSLTMWP